jgi:hypothetical protein
MVASRRLAVKTNASAAPPFDFSQERGSADSYGSPVGPCAAIGDRLKDLAWATSAASAKEAVMRLTSSAFPDGGVIPRRFTCDGEDVSPPLAWTDVLPDTRSLVLLCDDPDAPAGAWRHWAIYDIPADRTELAEDADRRAPQEVFKQAVNDFRRPGYGGPCPPPRRRHLTAASLSVR